MDFKTIASARNALAKGTVSLPELTQTFLNRINETNAQINAMVSVSADEALAQAASVQQKLKQGTAGKLAGAVIGIKDVIVQKGQLATCASNILRNYEGVYNATVIDRLLAEDAVLIGRTNMDEFAMGSSNENSIFGPVKNPHDLSRVPGGSSGGSAAAVAAQYCNASLGSDTGGSIRQPASYCGVVGLKPTYGRVSRYGLIAYASSFDSIGPFAHTTEDVAALLSVLAGRDAQDGTSSPQPLSDYMQAVAQPKATIRIGIPEEYFGEGLQPEVRAAVEATLKKLEANGATLVPIRLPHTKYAVATYYILATAEASSNLARFDGVRYGHRADAKRIKEELKSEEQAIKEELRKATGSDKLDLEKLQKTMDSALVRMYKQSRTEGFGSEVKRRIILGTYVLSAGYYDAYYGKAQRIRRLIQQDFIEAFAQCDVIASPTAPTTAFKIGEKMDDPIKMYLNDIYTISANLAGICGISTPVGLDSNGLPIGIQFMGKHFGESDILNASRLVELV